MSSGVEERILSIEQAAEETPWSKTTLYRLAPKEDSPFHKVGGRWVVVQSDLVEWVRKGPKPRAEGNPIAKHRRQGGDFMEEVARLREEL